MWQGAASDMFAARGGEGAGSGGSGVTTRCVAVCCSVLQYAAVCCNMLQCVAVRCSLLQFPQDLAAAVSVAGFNCNTLQHTATHCNTLQHTATHCNTLQHTELPLEAAVSLLSGLFLFCTHIHCGGRRMKLWGQRKGG